MSHYHKPLDEILNETHLNWDACCYVIVSIVLQNTGGSGEYGREEDSAPQA
jgi:hypothetical protein